MFCREKSRQMIIFWFLGDGDKSLKVLKCNEPKGKNYPEFTEEGKVTNSCLKFYFQLMSSSLVSDLHANTVYPQYVENVREIFMLTLALVQKNSIGKLHEKHHEDP